MNIKNNQSVGTNFGRLKVVEILRKEYTKNGAKEYKYWWKCECGCGAVVEYEPYKVKSGKVIECKSCAMAKNQNAKKKNLTKA